MGARPVEGTRRLRRTVTVTYKNGETETREIIYTDMSKVGGPSPNIQPGVDPHVRDPLAEIDSSATEKASRSQQAPVAIGSRVEQLLPLVPPRARVGPTGS